MLVVPGTESDLSAGARAPGPRPRAAAAASVKPGCCQYAASARLACLRLPRPGPRPAGLSLPLVGGEGPVLELLVAGSVTVPVRLVLLVLARREWQCCHSARLHSESQRKRLPGPPPVEVDSAMAT